VPRSATITTLPGLIRFAAEVAWRENNRRVANGAQTDRVVTLAIRHRPSVDFAGYWQRHLNRNVA
jgi:hypothetical protein